MQHLLLTRFQGALIGAQTIYLTSQQIAPNQLVIETAPALVGGIGSLTRCGRFDLQDWLQSTFPTTDDPRRAIVAMLPLMLFFHDDRVKLREVLVTACHSWQLDWETCSSAVVLGYIISRSLKETLTPRTVIAQMLDETSNLHPLLFQELGTIDRLLDSSSSLHRVIQKLTATAHPIITPTVLAIYCFLSTPEDFSLAMLRARRTDYDVRFTCALTGAIAGAYDSLTGIPLNGTLATQSPERWISGAEALLASWAGIEIDRHSTAPTQLLPVSTQPVVTYSLPVAAPQVMQRRD
jgi:ADP-ribosylglycohydrolase